MDTMTYASLAAIPGRLAQKNKQPVPPEIELTPLDLSHVTSNSVQQSFVRSKISHGQSRWIPAWPTSSLSQAPKGKHLPQTCFRVARMVHRFVATSPTLYLIGAVLFSFCALLVAFSL
jgi:hypothetical protein